VAAVELAHTSRPVHPAGPTSSTYGLAFKQGATPPVAVDGLDPEFGVAAHQVGQAALPIERPARLPGLKLLQGELGQSQAEEARLRLENNALRKEIERWRTLAGHVAAREAWAAQELEKRSVAPEAPNEEKAKVVLTDTSATMTASSASRLAEISKQYLNTWGAAMHRASKMAGTPPQHLHAGLSLLTCCVFFAFMYVWQGRKVVCGACCRTNQHQAVPPSPTSRFPFVQGTLRRLGLCSYQVEISDVHVGSLLAGRDVHVTISADRGQSMSSQVIQKCDGSFMRFAESFVFDVRTSDRAITLAVCDSGGTLAYIEFNAFELVNLSHRRHKEFYRTALIATEYALQALGEAAAVRKPYAAMRIRDVTSNSPTSPVEATAKGLP